MNWNELAVQAKSGDIDAQEKIIHWIQNKAKLFIQQNGYFVYGMTEEDMVQEILPDLWKTAIEKYDPTIQDFRVYMTSCIRRKLISVLQQSKYGKNQIFSNFESLETYKENGKFGTYHHPMMDFVSGFERIQGRQNDWMKDPYEQCEKKAFLEALKAYAKEHFSEMEYQVFCYRMEGYVPKEIKEETGWDKKMIDNATGRMKRKLKKFLAMYEGTGGSEYEPTRRRKKMGTRRTRKKN